MTNNIARPEYPRPQFKREAWLNLNGKWDFDFDDNNIGEKNNWFNKENLDKKIRVPFTYESKKSGINDKTSHKYIWYQRKFAIPKKQRGKKILLNFAAADYITKVWINGRYIGKHQGGYTSFNFDITNSIEYNKENNIVVKVKDSMSKNQPRGKQSWQEDNFECWYSRTTGIWQTVWLEFVNKDIFLKNVKMTPDIDQESIELVYYFSNSQIKKEYTIKTEIKYKEELVKKFSFTIENNNHKKVFQFKKTNSEMKLWEPNNPNLYDITFKIIDSNNEIVDRVDSYFGMRKISIKDGKILLNNKPFYQKLILDQGYWPDSIATPPSDEAIKKDLKITKEMGFNGVRKHQKIEDKRFYYWADKLGLVVWAEIGSTYDFNDLAVNNFVKEWEEIVLQLYNYASIIAWVPFNESWGIDEVKTAKKQQNFTEGIYKLTNTVDNTRPIITNDGWEHTISDIITLHDYEEDPLKIKDRYKEKEPIINNEILFNKQKYVFAEGYTYQNQPILMSEFGGIALKEENGWGYGKELETKEELLDRFKETISVIEDIEYLQGYCYTQLTDVEQEKNGLMYENRELKVPLESIQKILR
ncbi:MAG TPA: glycoside hydrolase family 2 TIM barrel-domain containing protein [Halanaerobiales bacterium]|nr:glycoside hydrolase family 2 TIM barrel-domain containing protein [Halanaerobiales bacterium]